MKSKMHTVTINQTKKDMVIKSDTIRLLRVVGSLSADIVWATMNNDHKTFGYEINWKVNVTTDSGVKMVASCQVDQFPEFGLRTDLVGMFVGNTIYQVIKLSMENSKHL